MRDIVGYLPRRGVFAHSHLSCEYLLCYTPRSQIQSATLFRLPGKSNPRELGRSSYC